MDTEKIYYTSTDPVRGRMTMNQFIETEVGERGNYTLANTKNWMQKYRISPSDHVIWVSPLKWVANRYNLLAEEWDRAKFIPESEMNVYEIRGDKGFIIPESDDGDMGYLFVFKKSSEALKHMIREDVAPAAPDVTGLVNRIVQEVRAKPFSAAEKRSEIVARLNHASDEINRKILTEIQSFRPLGVMSEFAEAMMGAGATYPKKGEPVRTPFGTIVFNEKRVPSTDRVSRWFAEYKQAEGIRKTVPEYAFGLEARPNTVTGNFRIVEHAHRLKAQGLLTPEEEKILEALERYWQSHPEFDREKGYGVWGYNLELMVPERLKAKAAGVSENVVKESLIDALLNIQPGRDILLNYGQIPERAERIKLPSGMGGMILERRGDLLAIGISAGAAVNAVLYVQKDSQLIRIRPIPHQKMQTRTGEIVTTPEYVRWVERITQEAPEYLPEWEKTVKGSAGIEKEKEGGAGMAGQYEERPPSQEVKDWMKRALNIEDYKGGRHDRIQMLALLIQNSELGNVRSIHDAGSMALALGKDLGYGTPPPYGKSLERYYAEKIAAETGREVPIIKSSDIIKPPSKEPLKSAEELYKIYTSGYSGISFLGIVRQDTKELADSILFDLRHLNLNPETYTKGILMSYAAKFKEWAQRDYEKGHEKIVARQQKEAAEKEKERIEGGQAFWNEVKNLKVVDYEVEHDVNPDYPTRTYYHVYDRTFAVLENGKRVQVSYVINKGEYGKRALKATKAYYAQFYNQYMGKPLSEWITYEDLIRGNRYEDYAKQNPVTVQMRFEVGERMNRGGDFEELYLSLKKREQEIQGEKVRTDAAMSRLEREYRQLAGKPIAQTSTRNIERMNALAAQLNSLKRHYYGLSDQLADVRKEISRYEQEFARKGIFIKERMEGGAVLHEDKPVYRYYYSHRPPGIGSQPEGSVNHESWLPARTTPHGRTAFGWVEYDRPLSTEEITGYELFEDEIELPRLVKEIVQFAKTEGIDEAMKEATSEYGRAVWEWLKSQKRIRAGMGQKEQIRAEIMRLAGIAGEPGRVSESISPSVKNMFEAYKRSTLLPVSVLASPQFMNDEKVADDIYRNIQVSKEEARRLVPVFREIVEKMMNKEELEGIKELFGIDVEKEAHKLGIDLTQYEVVPAGNKVYLHHRTIVQKKYELKSPPGYQKRREEEWQERHRMSVGRVAPTVITQIAPPAAITPPGKVQSAEEIKQQAIASIHGAKSVEELQPILKGIGFLPLSPVDRQELLRLYQAKYSELVAERPFGVPVKTEPEKPAVLGAPTPQQRFEAEQRRKAAEKRGVRGQPTLTGTVSTSRRLEEFGIKERMMPEQRQRYTIRQDGRVFANENDPVEAENIYQMLKRTYPKSAIDLLENLIHPQMHTRVLKEYNPMFGETVVAAPGAVREPVRYAGYARGDGRAAARGY